MSKARTGLKASGKDTAITIYSFRHAAITSLIADGLPVQSIANLAGTSPRMIHTNYGHLTDETTATALARLAL
jgi:site-specific recombinase XerD